MTPSEVIAQARNRYNSVSDTNFFTDSELVQYVYEAEMEMATQTYCVKSVDTSITTVNGTRSYSFPTNVFAIDRVEYDGYKLGKVDDKEEDSITVGKADTTNTGTPEYYRLWGNTIYLRPIPDAANTLTLLAYKLPTALNTDSTSLSVPTRYHTYLIDYVVAMMAEKDENYTLRDRLVAKFEANLAKNILPTEERLKRKDKLAITKNEDMLYSGAFGIK